jgi:hypothetical protein
MNEDTPMIIRLQGVARGDRHAMTTAASDAIVSAGGYVLDFNQFSNLAVCFTLELPAGGYRRLRELLANGGFDMTPPAAVEAKLEERDPHEAIPGSLRIEFRHHEPDLRIPIPAVPG